VLYTFTGGLDGAEPVGGLVEGKDGYLYGTAMSILYGSAPGTAFRMTLNGTLTVLHSFNHVTGFWPEARLIQAKDGFFYGATDVGGKFNHGTLFRLTPDGDFKIIHEFTGGIDGESTSKALRRPPTATCTASLAASGALAPARCLAFVVGSTLPPLTSMATT
jgi:uncharacterized repeat protein (TIGR03803 family)